jgi:hypothetical protein
MANIPFVSEEFQRAFRNQFPSQTSTGRDLHVSDIVIPVVDFTPTTSGASLPETLRTCRNGNTTQVIKTSSGDTFTDVGPGFYRISFIMNAVFSSGANGSIATLKLYDSTPANVATLLNATNANAKTPNYFLSDDFYAYVPAEHSIGTSLDLKNADGADLVVTYTLIADLNGNLTQPFGYDPQ